MAAAHRSAIREAAVQAVFEPLFRDSTADLPDLVPAFLRDLQLFELASFDREFAEKLLAAIAQNSAELRAEICRLAPQWPWEHIAVLDRAVLMTAIAELRFVADAPAGVVINEFVEIAKQYGGDSSRKFVNGVLSSVAKEVAAAPK